VSSLQLILTPVSSVKAVCSAIIHVAACAPAGTHGRHLLYATTFLAQATTPDYDADHEPHANIGLPFILTFRHSSISLNREAHLVTSLLKVQAGLERSCLVVLITAASLFAAGTRLEHWPASLLPAPVSNQRQSAGKCTRRAVCLSQLPVYQPCAHELPKLATHVHAQFYKSTPL
jgi:hypothetical protein